MAPATPISSDAQMSKIVDFCKEFKDFQDKKLERLLQGFKNTLDSIKENTAKTNKSTSSFQNDFRKISLTEKKYLDLLKMASEDTKKNINKLSENILKGDKLNFKELKDLKTNTSSYLQLLKGSKFKKATLVEGLDDIIKSVTNDFKKHQNIILNKIEITSKQRDAALKFEKEKYAKFVEKMSKDLGFKDFKKILDGNTKSIERTKSQTSSVEKLFQKELEKSGLGRSLGLKYNDGKSSLAGGFLSKVGIGGMGGYYLAQQLGANPILGGLLGLGAGGASYLGMNLLKSATPAISQKIASSFSGGVVDPTTGKIDYDKFSKMGWIRKRAAIVHSKGILTGKDNELEDEKLKYTASGKQSEFEERVIKEKIERDERLKEIEERYAETLSKLKDTSSRFEDTISRLTDSISNEAESTFGVPLENKGKTKKTGGLVFSKTSLGGGSVAREEKEQEDIEQKIEGKKFTDFVKQIKLNTDKIIELMGGGGKDKGSSTGVNQSSSGFSGSKWPWAALLAAGGGLALLSKELYENPHAAMALSQLMGKESIAKNIGKGLKFGTKMLGGLFGSALSHFTPLLGAKMGFKGTSSFIEAGEKFTEKGLEKVANTTIARKISQIIPDKLGGNFLGKAATEAQSDILKQSLKTGESIGGEELGKAGSKAAGKALGKRIVKFIPGVGLVLGSKFAYDKFQKGDYYGSGIELASGIAGLVPGLGTLASVGLDTVSATRDFSREGSYMKSSSALSKIQVSEANRKRMAEQDRKFKVILAKQKAGTKLSPEDEKELGMMKNTLSTRYQGEGRSQHDIENDTRIAMEKLEAEAGKTDSDISLGNMDGNIFSLVGTVDYIAKLLTQIAPKMAMVSPQSVLPNTEQYGSSQSNNGVYGGSR